MVTGMGSLGVVVDVVEIEEKEDGVTSSDEDDGLLPLLFVEEETITVGFLRCC